ncbi:MAG: hypothetical protein IPL53_17770 [Ignavibacteria bacterium]|nr:hypothetical protein [Ignavibacteria bacterium]
MIITVSSNFKLNTIEAYQYNYCDIYFAVDEIGEYGMLATTGWRMNLLRIRSITTLQIWIVLIVV